MANTFGDLVAALPAALHQGLRRQIGYVSAVYKDGRAAQAALNQPIQFTRPPEMEVVDAAANCCELPCPPDQSYSTDTMTITNDKAVRFCWTGEDEKKVNNSGYETANSLKTMSTDEAVSELIDLVELSIAGVAYKANNIYVPVDGGALFNDPTDNFRDIINVRRDMNRLGIPRNDRHLVMGDDASANMLNLPNLSRANEAGTDQQLREGALLRLYGMDLHESFAADDLTNSGATGSGYEVVGAHSSGDKTIAIDTGTGTIPAGTKVSFAGNSDSYYVQSFSGGVLTLSKGLSGDIADNAAVTIDADGYRSQLAFHRNAIVLATRLPSIPAGGDAAQNRAIIQDPRTGIALMVSQYGVYRSIVYEIGMVWGVEMVNPNLAVLIAG